MNHEDINSFPPLRNDIFPVAEDIGELRLGVWLMAGELSMTVGIPSLSKKRINAELDAAGIKPRSLGGTTGMIMPVDPRRVPAHIWHRLGVELAAFAQRLAEEPSSQTAGTSELHELRQTTPPVADHLPEDTSRYWERHKASETPAASSQEGRV